MGDGVRVGVGQLKSALTLLNDDGDNVGDWEENWMVGREFEEAVLA